MEAEESEKGLNGSRVQKTVGGVTTTYYYSGGRRVAMSVNGTLKYVHQDHLTGTSVMTSANTTPRRWLTVV